MGVLQTILIILFIALFVPTSIEVRGLYFRLADVVLLLGLSLLLFSKLLKGNLNFTVPPYWRIFLGMIIVAIIGLYDVQNYFGSVGDIIQLIEIYILAGILFASILTKELLKKIAVIIVLGIVVQSVMIVPSMISNHRLWGWMGGSFPFVTCIAFIIVYHVFLYGNSSQRVVSFFLLALLGIELVLTGTRSAWLGVFGGVICANAVRGQKYVLTTLVKFGLIVFLLLGLGSTYVKGRITSIVNPHFYSNVSRFYLISTAWNAFLANPFLGVGLNNLSNLQMKYVPREALLIPEGNHRIAREISMKAGAHNMYFSVLAEMGIMGFCFLVSLVFSSVKEAFQNTKTAKTPHDNAVNSCILACLVAFYILAFFVPGIHLRTDYSFFFVLLLVAIKKFRSFTETGIGGVV